MSAQTIDPVALAHASLKLGVLLRCDTLASIADALAARYGNDAAHALRALERSLRAAVDDHAGASFTTAAGPDAPPPIEGMADALTLAHANLDTLADTADGLADRYGDDAANALRALERSLRAAIDDHAGASLTTAAVPGAPPGRPIEGMTPGQDPPIPSDGADIVLMVIADMNRRRAFGIAKYGMPLREGNGRDPDLDAYEEAVDLVFYLRQRIAEREARGGRSLTIDDVIAQGRATFGGHRLGLPAISLHATALVGALADQARAQQQHGVVAGRDVGGLLGDLALSALRWADDLGLDVGEALADAQRTQATYARGVLGITRPADRLTCVLTTDNGNDE